MEKFTKPRLLCPGPTPVTHSARLAMQNTEVYHRSAFFKEKFLEARSKLGKVFQGEEDPLILTASGTGAMEAAVVNLTSAGDQVLVISTGKFGERWAEINATYKNHLVHMKLEWGESPDPDKLEQLLKTHPSIKAFFIQANETSSGVSLPIRDLIPIVKRHTDALIVVDAISGMIAENIPMKELGIDCLISGSQKGFGIPPGLSFIALSHKAWSALSERPRFYFDLEKERKGQANGLTSWTPATTLVFGLNASLDEILRIGLDNLANHHSAAAAACAQFAAKFDFELLAKSHPSKALTAIKLPSDIDGKKLLKDMSQRYNIIVAGGQDQLQGRIIRVAHLGLFDRMDLVAALSALEKELNDIGYESKRHASVNKLL